MDGAPPPSPPWVAPAIDSSAASLPGMEAPLERKVQQQARKLLVQQQSLLASLSYGQLLERRLRQLVPEHPLPLTPEMLQDSELDSALTEPAARLASLEAALSTMTERAKRAEAECEALRSQSTGAAPAPSSSRSGPGGASTARPASAGSSCAAARPTAASRARKQAPAAAPPASSASAAFTATTASSTVGWCSVGAGGAANSSTTSGRGGTSIEALRLERTKLQKALREAREEVATVRRHADRDIAEAHRALEEAGLAAGLPQGAGQILQAHAASERRLGELGAALEESERKGREAA